MWWYLDAHLCSGNRLIPGTHEAQELALFGDDQILRAHMNCRKGVQNVHEIEIQLSATNPNVYNSGIGQIDKSDKHTNSLGQPLYCVGEDTYLLHVCSCITTSKLYSTTFPLPSILYCFLLHSSSEDLSLLDTLFI